MTVLRHRYTEKASFEKIELISPPPSVRIICVEDSDW
jgi:hypothetical protein